MLLENMVRGDNYVCCLSSLSLWCLVPPQVCETITRYRLLTLFFQNKFLLFIMLPSLRYIVVMQRSMKSLIYSFKWNIQFTNSFFRLAQNINHPQSLYGIISFLNSKNSTWWFFICFIALQRSLFLCVYIIFLIILCAEVFFLHICLCTMCMHDTCVG